MTGCSEILDLLLPGNGRHAQTERDGTFAKRQVGDRHSPFVEEPYTPCSRQSLVLPRPLHYYDLGPISSTGRSRATTSLCRVASRRVGPAVQDALFRQYYINNIREECSPALHCVRRVARQQPQRALEAFARRASDGDMASAVR